MRIPRAALAVLLAACLFAGCAQKPESGPATASSPSDSPRPTTIDAGQGTGTVEGTVTQDDLTPVAEATVIAQPAGSPPIVGAFIPQAQPGEQRVSSAADGSFRIFGLAPGSYNFVATKDGFKESPGRTVDVKSDETATVKLVIVALPSTTPSHLTVPFVTKEMTIKLRHPAGEQPIIGGGNLNPTDTTQYRGGFYQVIEESSTALLQTVMIEARWTANQDACKFGMQSYIHAPGISSGIDKSEASKWTLADPAKNPSSLRAEREGTEDAMMSDARTQLNGGKPITTTGKWFVGSKWYFVGTLGTPVDASCAVDQKTEAWGSFFMVAPAPADWTALS